MFKCGNGSRKSDNSQLYINFSNLLNQFFESMMVELVGKSEL